MTQLFVKKKGTHVELHCELSELDVLTPEYVEAFVEI